MSQAGVLMDLPASPQQFKPNPAAEGCPRGRKCHYCGEPATTKDHIVARTFVRRTQVPQWVYQANLVPSCYQCNQAKMYFRSDCDCLICLAAWALLGPMDQEVPVVAIVNRCSEAA